MCACVTVRSAVPTDEQRETLIMPRMVITMNHWEVLKNAVLVLGCTVIISSLDVCTAPTDSPRSVADSRSRNVTGKKSNEKFSPLI